MATQEDKGVARAVQAEGSRLIALRRRVEDYSHLEDYDPYDNTPSFWEEINS